MNSFRAFFLFTLIHLLLFLYLTGQQADPRIHFDKRYDEAVKFIRHNASRLANLIDYEGGNREIIIPVIFPELIRYSMWKDYFETKANELMYIQGEPQGKYFSIGMYQIKPSFAEKVEATIQSIPNLAADYDILYSYPVTGEEAIRAERLRRLKSWIWQTRYVIGFTRIVESRFNLQEMTIEQKISFMCSAYNHDFLCDSTEIADWIGRKSFPYGLKRENPFTYAEVALYFYRNDYPAIFSGKK